MSLTTNATRASPSSGRRSLTSCVSRCRETGIVSATRSPTTSASSTPGIFGFSDRRGIAPNLAVYCQDTLSAFGAENEATLHDLRKDQNSHGFLSQGGRAAVNGIKSAESLGRIPLDFSGIGSGKCPQIQTSNACCGSSQNGVAARRFHIFCPSVTADHVRQVE